MLTFHSRKFFLFFFSIVESHLFQSPSMICISVISQPCVYYFGVKSQLRTTLFLQQPECTSGRRTGDDALSSVELDDDELSQVDILPGELLVGDEVCQLNPRNPMGRVQED